MQIHNHSKTITLAMIFKNLSLRALFHSGLQLACVCVCVIYVFANMLSKLREGLKEAECPLLEMTCWLLWKIRNRPFLTKKDKSLAECEYTYCILVYLSVTKVNCTLIFKRKNLAHLVILLCKNQF